MLHDTVMAKPEGSTSLIRKIATGLDSEPVLFTCYTHNLPLYNVILSSAYTLLSGFFLVIST